MEREFKVNEGELITIFNEKEEITLGGTLMFIFMIPVFWWMLSLIISPIFKLFIEERKVDNYEIFVLVILNLLSYLMRFISFLIEINTDNSIEIHYFNDYLLLNKIPRYFEPTKKGNEVTIKISFELIDYFILKYNRLHIKLKRDENKNYENLNKNTEICFESIVNIMDSTDLKLDKKFRLKKNEIINLLNLKL